MTNVEHLIMLTLRESLGDQRKGMNSPMPLMRRDVFWIRSLTGVSEK